MDIAIWGAGQVARKLLSYDLQAGNTIVGVFDNDKNKWDKCTLGGHSVESPHALAGRNFDFILLAVVRGIWDIKQQLIEMGISEQKILLGLGWSAVDYYQDTVLDMIFRIEKKPFVPFTDAPAEIYRQYEGATTQAHERRMREGFFDKYCQGKGLDVGYGGDVIAPGCAGWDLRNGDAQYLQGVPDESFDYVYSSHCLEHMNNVRVSLQNWFRCVKKGGYLLIYIPHRDLYEKQTKLPSRFNPHHKHMFLIGKSELPDTLDIVEEIAGSLEGYEIVYVKICDEGHVVNPPKVEDHGEYSIEMVIKKLCM